MADQRIPDAVLDAARARAQAREARNWTEADRLRAEIEAAGWTVVDRGTRFSLAPAHPPTLEDAGRTRYGSSGDVPSRLDDAPVGVASVISLATDWPEDVEREVSGIQEHGPDGTHIVVVANGPSAEQEAALLQLEALDSGAPGIRTEVVWTSARLGHAAALNVGIRRAEAGVVVIVDPSVEFVGDAITPLVAALDDQTVAVAGAWGVTSDDLRRFEEAPPGDVAAIEGYLLAFRRADYAERGALDERFRFYRNLDIWWSLVLRDQGDGARPRRAVALADLPVVRHEHRDWVGTPTADRDRLSKRNFYRILDRFGRRLDLVSRSPEG